MHVFLIAAISVDGFISPTESTTSTVWTSAGDKQFFSERTKQAKVMVMGRTTFETVGRPLPGRQTIVMSSQPKPEKYSQFGDEQVKYIKATPGEVLVQLENEGYEEVAICGGSSVYAQFMEAGLIDTLYLTVEPISFGQGIPLFSQAFAAKQLQLTDSKKIDENTILLEYSVEK